MWRRLWFASRRSEFERLADARAQVGIGDLDAVGLLQHELAQPVGAKDCDAGTLHRRLRLAGGCRQRLGDAFGVHDAAGHRARALHADLHALQAVQVVDRRSQRLRAERHVAEIRPRVVASRQFHRADRAGAVEHHERGQHVVHLIERHVEAECRRAIHLGLVFEVADTGRRQHHPLQ